MDFNEYKIRPLTEGLGFHSPGGSGAKPSAPNTYPSQAPTPAAPAPQRETATPYKTSPTLPNYSPEANLQNFTQTQVSPRPRWGSPTPTPGSIRPPSPKIPWTAEHADFLNSPTPSKTRTEFQVKTKTELTALPSTVSLPAFFVDLTTTVGLSALFTATLLSITGVTVSEFISVVTRDNIVFFAMAALSVSLFQIYAILARSFAKHTLGEWAFDLQMGTAAQSQKANYPLKVLLRSFVICASGFVTLPILSRVIGKDLTSPLTGLKLFHAQKFSKKIVS